jgi:phosphoribosyl 1,2-cyclic phosphodiesterase
MFIRCWGARGSIPVSGKNYEKYGGDTTCLEVRNSAGDIIIIDAGSGIRNLGNQMISENKKNFIMLFTHAHWDHLMGFPFFKPIYRKNSNLSFYGCPFAQGTIKNIVSGTMQPPNFPVRYSDIKLNVNYHSSCRKKFDINGMLITPTLLSHPNKGIGFKFEENGKSFVFLTDNELTYTHDGGLEFEDYVNFSKNADLLIHDSEYTREEYDKTTKMWGHSVYEDALELAFQANVKELGLFHHNQDRSDKEQDEILNRCNQIIENKKRKLKCFCTKQFMEINL